MKLLVIASDGWPVEKIKGRRVSNAIRLVLHGRRIVCAECWHRKERERQRRDAHYDPVGTQKEAT